MTPRARRLLALANDRAASPEEARTAAMALAKELAKTLPAKRALPKSKVVNNLVEMALQLTEMMTPQERRLLMRRLLATMAPDGSQHPPERGRLESSD